VGGKIVEAILISLGTGAVLGIPALALSYKHHKSIPIILFVACIGANVFGGTTVAIMAMVATTIIAIYVRKNYPRLEEHPE
jgi:Na+/H+ antiporter NhaC